MDSMYSRCCVGGAVLQLENHLKSEYSIVTDSFSLYFVTDKKSTHLSYCIPHLMLLSADRLTIDWI